MWSISVLCTFLPFFTLASCHGHQQAGCAGGSECSYEAVTVPLLPGDSKLYSVCSLAADALWQKKPISSMTLLVVGLMKLTSVQKVTVSTRHEHVA